MSEWNMDGKNVAIMIIIVLLFYKIVLFSFIQRLEDHRQQRSSFERLGVPKLG
jgi:CHASE1-domain containing sensor protein